jgi:putative ABC transport system substrate-binding protein
MRELGYVEGQNFTVEERYSEGRDEQFPALAAELVGLPVDLIVVSGTPGSLAVKQTTATIPIVAISGNPVETGLVDSQGRPGGNVTGLRSQPAGGLEAKWLELLQAMIPSIQRVSFLGNAGSPAHTIARERMQHAAQHLGIQVRELLVQGPDDLSGVLAAGLAAETEAILIGGDPLTAALRPQILQFATRQRLPLMADGPFLEGGGLFYYGASLPSVLHRAATYVDKILKGVKPSDLPVEGPTVFDFIINLKTATALGLTIPQSVLLQATEVIQ